MNENIQRLTREIERRGGAVIVGDRIPDHVLEILLREVLACPCCAKSARAGRETGSGSYRRR